MLINLKNKYCGQKAVIIMGGPSILKNNLNLSLLNQREDKIFIEPKTLTRKFIDFDLIPDYILATFPEKLRTNTLQYTFLQAIANNYDLTYSLKEEFIDTYIDFVENFAEYAEIWRVNFPHKRFKIKKNVILKDSPNDILKNYPNIPIISYEKAVLSDGFKDLGFGNTLYEFDIRPDIFFKQDGSLDFDKYLNPDYLDNKVIVNGTDSLNSATIGIIPILNFLGFKQICFIGKDMSMLGAMEYSCEYIFKSMRHYNAFFNSNRLVFSYGFPRGTKYGFLSFLKNTGINIVNRQKKERNSNPNLAKKLLYDIWGLKGKFMRERKQFSDYKSISDNSSINFVNVYEPTSYASKVPGMNNITFETFLKEY